MTPLALLDGTLINTSDGTIFSTPEEKDETAELEEVGVSNEELEDVKSPDETTSPNLVPIPTNQEAVRTVVGVKRRIADMPAVPRQMNAVSVVVAYTLYGLSDNDIAIAANISTQQVENIKMSEAYDEMYKSVLENIRQADSSQVTGLLQQASVKAARKIVHFAENDEGALGFKASQDILDRSGHRPADIIEHRHSMQGKLQIEVVKRSSDTNVVIDLKPDEVD